MASLNGIEFALRQLLQTLRQEGLALLAAPGRARPDEADYQVQTLRLQGLAERLQLALRDLRNRDQLQDLRARRIHDLPRDARHAERQSIGSHRANVERVRRLAVEAVNELLRIDALRHAPPSLHDMVRGLQEIADDSAQRWDQAQALGEMIQLQHDGVSLRAAPPPRASAADLANLLVTTVMLAAWLIRRLRR